MKRVLAALMTIALLTSTSFADITITQSDTETAYTGFTANFDDGAPTGVNLDPYDFYQADSGLFFTSNSGFLVADAWDDMDGIDGGASPGTNQLQGGFGVRFNFDQAATELSFQGWAPGSPTPPLGGINVFVFSEGVQVGAYSGVSPFGGVGDEWFNVVATDGDTFDELVFFNGAFNSFSSYVDNVSFNVGVIPEPTSLAVLAIAGLAVLRRRR